MLKWDRLTEKKNTEITFLINKALFGCWLYSLAEICIYILPLFFKFVKWISDEKAVNLFVK